MTNVVIPTTCFRATLVILIALHSDQPDAVYLYCSTQTTFFATAQTTSCCSCHTPQLSPTCLIVSPSQLLPLSASRRLAFCAQQHHAAAQFSGAFQQAPQQSPGATEAAVQGGTFKTCSQPGSSSSRQQSGGSHCCCGCGVSSGWRAGLWQQVCVVTSCGGGGGNGVCVCERVDYEVWRSVGGLSSCACSFHLVGHSTSVQGDVHEY
jgi:hypothetical protein